MPFGIHVNKYIFKKILYIYIDIKTYIYIIEIDVCPEPQIELPIFSLAGQANGKKLLKLRGPKSKVYPG